MYMNTSAEIDQHIEKLPENIQRAIRDFDWGHEVLAIAHKFHIQIDEISLFHMETQKLILGLISKEDYVDLLVSDLKISQDKAQDLLLLADERIFNPLQRMAFSKKVEVPNQEKYLVHNEKLAQLLRDEGVTVHEKEQESDKNQEDALLESELESLVDEAPKETEPAVISYQEPIDDFDMLGVRSHRIETTEKISKKPKLVTNHAHYSRIDIDNSGLVSKKRKNLSDSL